MIANADPASDWEERSTALRPWPFSPKEGTAAQGGLGSHPANGEVAPISGRSRRRDGTAGVDPKQTLGIDSAGFA
jgi:hypothetical protein